MQIEDLILRANTDIDHVKANHKDSKKRKNKSLIKHIIQFVNMSKNDSV
jgi:hypothetical protein